MPEEIMTQVSPESDVNGIAKQYHDGYKSWLKHTAKITSMHNALTFLKHSTRDWRQRWGIIKTDRIAQELHHHLMK